MHCVQRAKCQTAILVLYTEHSRDWQQHDFPCYNKILVTSPGQSSVVTLLLIRSHFPIHVTEANHSTSSTDALKNIQAEVQQQTYWNVRFSWEEDLCTWMFRDAYVCLQVMTALLNVTLWALLYAHWTKCSKIAFMQTGICQWCGKLIVCIHTE
jgi:hypothetical protein